MQWMRGWRVAIVLAAAGAAGCASRWTEDDILNRLERSGIRLSDAETATRSQIEPVAGVAPRQSVVGLGELISQADRVNPEIRAARARVGVAAGRAWQAGLYPNPSIGLSASEIGFDRGTSNTVVSVSQPIVLGSRLQAGVAAGQAEQAARLADVERVRRAVAGRVGEAHAQVLELSAQLGLVDELVTVAERTLSIAQTRFEAGAVSEVDVIRPRVEVQQLRADRHRLARELEGAERQLGLLLDEPPIRAGRLSGEVVMDPPVLDEDSVRRAVEEGHPAMWAADRAIEAAEAALERVRAERRPDLIISAGVGYSEEGDQGIAQLGVGAEMPLWDRRQGDVMAARFELMQRRQEKMAVRNDLLARLAEELVGYQAARDQLVVLRDQIVPDAQRAFEQVEQAYRAGNATFIDLLDTQRTLMQSRRTLLELAGRASVARARIAGIAGLDVLAIQLSEPGHAPVPARRAGANQ